MESDIANVMEGYSLIGLFSTILGIMLMDSWCINHSMPRLFN